jgi:hypothetical protein
VGESEGREVREARSKAQTKNERSRSSEDRSSSEGAMGKGEGSRKKIALTHDE